MKYKVGDKVIVTSGKLEGRVGTVVEIEHIDGGITVSVDIPSWGVYVHDSFYFEYLETKNY